MNIVISDITGRTLNYDYALCDAICNTLEPSNRIEFWGPHKEHDERLVVRSFASIVPRRFKTCENALVRILKAIDAVIAYILIFFYILRQKPDVFHLQWFPFLSLGEKGAWIDRVFLKLVKKASKKTKLVFTIHNICPHGMTEEARTKYNPIFANALKLFDHFVVHTENTKDEVIKTFNLNKYQVSTVYHGVFIPKNVIFTRKPWNPKKVKLIMYGAQNWYKGTDIFIEALSLLPNEYKNHISVSICGVIDKDTKSKCMNIITNCDIEWLSYFLDDDLLYKKISEADIILLPYRRISQSGVLLLALATKRLIITSDLPTFKETLCLYDDDLFFDSENPQSLTDLICKYLSGDIDTDKVLENLGSLSQMYSWNESAKTTISMYTDLIKS